MMRKLVAVIGLTALFLLVLSGVSRAAVASHYGAGEKLSRHTANGERFNARAMTAAHWTLPFGSHVKVTNPKNGKSVVVRINDRGPHPRLRRDIDLSFGAFKRIASRVAGVIHVTIKRVSR